jgi:hypothetical protein
MNLVIQSEGSISLTFHSRTIGENGWVSAYFVTAEAPNFKAAVEVDNAPYGSPPSELFGEFAAEWRGWQGVKQWQALDGEYALSATADSAGHVTLVAKLNTASYPSTWEAKVSLVLEAGALDRLAAEAKEFFNPIPARAGA